VNYPSQEDLLGYVLGALDAQEQRDLQQQIDNDPSIEETLLDLKAALVPLDCLDSQGSRPGLARRTCEAVATWDAKSAAARLAFLDYTSIDWEEGCDQTPSNPTPNHTNQIDPTDRPAVAAVSLNGPGDAPELLAANDATAQTTIDVPQTHQGDLLNVNAAPSGGAVVAPAAQLSTAAGSDFNLRSSWSIRDMLVGAAALAVLASLLLPALSSSRDNSQVLACQNNLRQLGMAFRNYSAINDGGFIAIPRNGNLAVSGCFGPILKDAGLLEDDSLLACAGVDGDEPPVVIPSIAQIESATDQDQRLYYRRTMAGHFGYSMGYRDGDEYRAPREGTAQVILLADRPSTAGDRQSQNHGGRGQNCLFSDGHVEFVAGPAYGSDMVYENDYGIVGPGSNLLDNVIAPSHLSPVF
jgi:prepilin-type processing-associated H-X9-DG protein